jgi:hypothetical protein
MHLSKVSNYYANFHFKLVNSTEISFIMQFFSGAIQPERTGTPFRFKFILEYAVPVHLCKNSYKIGYFSKISRFS